MTIYEAIYSPWRLPLMGVLFLMMTGQMATVVAALRDGRSRRARLALLIPFLLGAVIFWLSMSIAWGKNFHSGFAGLPGWLAAVGGLPAWAMALAEAPLALCLALSVKNTLFYRKTHVTPDNVKETMDLLPVGVAFAGADGGVLFRNVAMEQLSLALTGKLMTDMDRFRAAAGEEPVSLEGRVWQIDARGIEDRPLTQLTALDITEQAGILSDLQAKNKKLKDIHLRLEMYNRQAERIIIAQEMLTARMAVHDQLGHILLESRHYLNDPDAFDGARFLQALKNTNTYLLREYEQDDTARDPLSDAVDMAETIGVEVTIAGRVPQEEPARGLLAAAVQECAANTVKHAGGTALDVRISREKNGLCFALTGNGAPPAGPIRESGGLRSLRQLIESKGGGMTVASVPQVRITVTLPKTPTF